MAFIALPYFLATPTEPNGAGIVVGHEGMGMNRHVMRFCEQLAQAGYLAIAPEWFFRTGGPMEYEDWWAAIDAITPEQLRADMTTAIGVLRKEGATSIGVTGFCMGGNFSHFAAKLADELGVDATVPFYGGRIADELGELHCPTLFIFAGDDEWVPADAIAAVRERHGDAVVVYPEAHHSFMNDEGPTHDPDVAADAWARMIGFFRQHLGA